MRFLTVLVGTLILSLHISEISCAYDDPTQPSSVEPSSVKPSSVKPSSTQPFVGKRQAGENLPVIKNGNPCIEELCINDEIKDLGHINWKTVPIIGRAQYSYLVMAIDDPRANQFITNSPIKAIGDSKAIATFAKYLSLGKIDGVGLQAMSKIQGFCSQPIGSQTGRKLIGEYINKKGQSVTVDFYVTPSSDGKKQKFIVVRIDKIISNKGKLTYEQIDDLKAQAKQKYRDLPNVNQARDYYPKVSVGYSFGTSYLTLQSQFKYGEHMPGLLDIKVINPTTFMYFPGCGADKKIEL